MTLRKIYRHTPSVLEVHSLLFSHFPLLWNLVLQILHLWWNIRHSSSSDSAQTLPTTTLAENLLPTIVFLWYCRLNLKTVAAECNAQTWKDVSLLTPILSGSEETLNLVVFDSSYCSKMDMRPKPGRHSKFEAVSVTNTVFVLFVY